MDTLPAPGKGQLLEHLRCALLDGCASLAAGEMQLLPDKGLAHDHVRLLGTGLLARIPKQSQLGLSPLANLAYQRTCFERCAASGHTPRLRACLPPSVHLTRGALLVEEIVGRAAELPGDLPFIARAFGELHRLPVPLKVEREPLLSPVDPLRSLWNEIDGQAQHLGSAGIATPVRQAIELELAALGRLIAATDRPPQHLIAFDGHPGNFILAAENRAVLVDLEKCRYGYPGLDLAHATLYTSTTWDVESYSVLSVAQVDRFYLDWSEAAGPAVALPARAWHAPLRRAMWVWSLTWCAK
ncbi:MAG: aminoglycoside phosphotransferase family protein, partial [Pseudomonadota bacterium]|nr:aminoglycoside phosphotransferase family protein [Pseudomonadota bacterium]